MTAEVCKESIWNYKTHCFFWREGNTLAEVINYLQMLSSLEYTMLLLSLGYCGRGGGDSGEEKKYKPI